MLINVTEKDLAAIDSALAERVRLYREASSEHLENAPRLGQLEKEGKRPSMTEAAARRLAAAHRDVADHAQALRDRLNDTLYGEEPCKC